MLGDLPPWFLRAFALTFGLVWGSFLNVVIYRLPREMSVVRPGSHCPACGKPVRAWDNIPVLSYFILRGRARCCKAKLSARYPLVETIGGVLSLAILEVIVLRLPGSTSIARALSIYIADLALALGLVAAAFIDLEHMYLPDEITFGGTVVGLATFSFREMMDVDVPWDSGVGDAILLAEGFVRPMDPLDALIGAAVGFVILWLPFVYLYRRVFGRHGMGMGDPLLLMLSGAWFGWTGVLLVLAASAWQGLLIALPILLVRGKIEEPEAVRKEREQMRADMETMTPEERAEAEQELEEDPLGDEPQKGWRTARIALGPFLALATLEYLLLGRDVVAMWVG